MPIDRRTLLRAGAGATLLSIPGIVGMTGARSAPARGDTPRPWDTTTPWDTLAGRLSGSLVLPSDAGYAVAKQSHWSEFDTIDPNAVAYCASSADVAACVLFAQDNGVQVAVRSGGHSPGGYSTTTGLVVDVSRLNQLRVGDSTVTVGAGTQQIDVLGPLAARGLALSGGSCPTVGLGGFVQGGGFGLLTRAQGMACDHLVSAEVVLADGRIVSCSENEEPDLYWALRGGGGGNFGVVTQFELAPVVISQLSSYELSWPWADAATAIAAWQDWIATAPRELSSILTVTLPDAQPGAVPLVLVTGAWCGTPGLLDGCLDALVTAVGTAPTARTSTAGTYQDTMMATYGCADLSADQCHSVGYSPVAELPRGEYLLARSRMISTELPSVGVDALLAAFDADRTAGHTRALNFAALGGKVNDVDRTATAYVHRDTRFLALFADSLPTGTPTPQDRAAAESWAAGGFLTVDPYSNHETYQNYTDPALADWRSAYYAENYPRLAEVKYQYDPNRFFRFAQAID
ncbi:FAD-dependent oxidoreductase [Streptacidiphilus sp. P02-A3a]|uniref:FAD-dependent oxidoreductase n=1 Tax=Streptacidiphilus sp. P02-A3a TaxID=2704468 RepID=UPI001CDB7A37|nr:FAD-dependent oxidoreductase [Streptacidiphilus sp. P02-A3a]